MGGIGNQMFQYALGRQLAQLKHVPLKLDVTSFRAEATRAYSLGCFKVVEDFANQEEIERFKGNREIYSSAQPPYPPTPFPHASGGKGEVWSGMSNDGLTASKRINVSTNRVLHFAEKLLPYYRRSVVLERHFYQY